MHFPPGEYELRRMFYHLASKVILCCHGIKKYFDASGLMKKNQINVVPNFVNSDYFCPAPRNDSFRYEHFKAKPESIVLTLVGHLSEVKGQEAFIQASAKLIEKGYDIKAVMVGKDNSQDQHSYRLFDGMIKDQGLSDKVLMLGKISNVREVIAQSDIFVLPSLKEGMPLVILGSNGLRAAGNCK